jgi:phenylpropionate dioxygenase-like ring-hydroxylating dioxygenase large terminal subunit
MSAFVRNAWYPAAWSRDIGHGLAHRKILGEPVVLYRLQSGEIAALEDICPHRFAPLSMGKLKGDAVECGYHGMTFDRSGRCVRIPGQEIIPANAKVRSYPITENMGLAWIWMGVPELAAATPVYDLPEYHDGKWSAVEGDALPIACHYLSLADNLCDPAHVSFVHLSTLGSAASEDIPVQFERKAGDGLLTWRWIMDSPAIPLFQKFGNFSGNVDRWHYYHYHAPSIAVIDFGSAPTGTGAPEGRRDDCVQIFSCHFITPVDQTSCIDHWLYVKNFYSDEATTQAMSDQFRLAFNEDKVILEAIQHNERLASDRRPLRLAIDAPPVNMRRMIDRMIERETPNATEGVTAA